MSLEGTIIHFSVRGPEPVHVSLEEVAICSISLTPVAPAVAAAMLALFLRQGHQNICVLSSQKTPNPC